MQLPRFEDLAASADATLDLLALALAAAFRPVEAARALATLDGLGAEVVRVLDGSAHTPRAAALGLSHVLGTVHGFTGDTEQDDRPENSMLDRVLERQRGLPILLSVVYVEAARRADVPLAGLSLGCPAITWSPISVGSSRCCSIRSAGVRKSLAMRPRRSCVHGPRHETAMRMLNNLVPAFRRRGDLTRALRAAEMRLAVPADTDEHDRGACRSSVPRFAPDSTERARRFRRGLSHKSHDARPEIGDVHDLVISASEHLSRQISRSETGVRIAAGTYATAPSKGETFESPPLRVSVVGPTALALA